MTLNRRLHPYFNPRSRVGSDPVSKGRIKLDEIEFQSTLPRRERRQFRLSILFHQEFQSTLPRRERQTVEDAAKLSAIFQSTLPRRERLAVHAEAADKMDISIHAPA